MDRDGVPGAEGGHRRPRHRQGKGRHAKAPPGLRVVERDGFWHIHGTIRVGGRSKRVRTSTELPARPETRDHAEEIKLRLEREARDEVVYGIKPTVAFAVAADQYLNRPRKRPLNGIDVARIQELARAFGLRDLNGITEDEWNAFVDNRCARVAPQTRERYLSLVVGFLNWCSLRPRRWITHPPHFERDPRAKKKRAVHRRRVVDLTPDLIALLIEHSGDHLAAQLAVEWATGARVSSVLFGCRLCDLNLAPGRETITFQRTKSGEPTTAALHPWAVELLHRYVKWRGDLHDREAPLFLTHRRKPYTYNPKVSSGQNRTAFEAARRRAVAALWSAGEREARALQRQGRTPEADAVLFAMQAQADLLGQVTQHWFRHALATNMLAAGADIRTVMSQGGWLTAESALIYGHTVPERQRELVNSLPSIDTKLTRASKEEKLKA